MKVQNNVLNAQKNKHIIILQKNVKNQFNNQRQILLNQLLFRLTQIIAKILNSKQIILLNIKLKTLIRPHQLL